MFLLAEALLHELQRNAHVQSFNIRSDQAITSIEPLPVWFKPGRDPAKPDTLYICEYWQLKRFNPREELPLLLCVVEDNADTNPVFFMNRSVAVVYGTTVIDVLLALTNSAYDLGCKSSLITELSRTFLKCTSLNELIAEGYRALKNPLIVTDRRQQILYFTDPEKIASPIYRGIVASEYLPVGHPLAYTTEVSWSNLNIPFVSEKGDTTLFPVICKPLVVGNAIIGYLQVLEFNHSFEEQDSNVVELLGNLLTIELWRRRKTQPHGIQDEKERFLRDILDNLIGDAERTFHVQSERRLTFLPHMYTMILNPKEIMPMASPEHIQFSDLVSLVKSSVPGSLPFVFRNSVFVLLESQKPISDFETFLEPLKPSLDRYHLMAGISKELPSVTLLREAAFQSRKALQLGHGLRPDQMIYCYEDYTFYYMMELCLSTEDFNALIPTGFRKLLEYSEENGTELLDTLRVYLECGRSKALAAKQLHMHVNTVKYRLSQIEEIVGMSNDSDETALMLNTAFKMEAFRKAFPHIGPLNYGPEL